VLPNVLASPPWRPARVRKILALDPSVPERFVLDDARRAKWLDPSGGAPPDSLDAMPEPDRVAHILSLFETRGIVPMTATRHLNGEVLRRAISVSDGYFRWHYRLFERLIATEGLAGIPFLVDRYDSCPTSTYEELILCADTVEVTRTDVLMRGHRLARRLSAHPRTTARVLLSLALGNSRVFRAPTARAVSRFDENARAALRAAADEYGPDAREELEALWRPEPLPPRAPKTPAFLANATLPTVTLVGGEPLPETAQSIFVALLSLLPLETAREAIESAIPSLDPSSLASLADALLDRWLAADAPVKDRWVLFAVGLLGGEHAARRLVEMGEAWAKSGKSARAGLAFEAVGEIGSDVALMHLDHLARTSKVKPLKKRAEAVLASVREERGWSEDELSDRLVPTLGFGDDGFVHASLGAHRLRVGLDETLAPTLRTEAGETLAKLPRAEKNEDADARAALTDRLAQLKKDLKVIGPDQVRRLERALGSQRRWRAEDFDAHLRRHPVMTHLARRLVWLASDGTSFRCVDDGSLATPADETWELSPDLDVRLAHPLELGAEACAAWSTTFGDYQLLQPFPQLQREAFSLTAEERARGIVDRFVGARVPGARFFSLKHRGWDFRDYDLGKALGRAGRATLRTEPGLGFLGARPEDQTLGTLELRGLDGVSDVALSEVLRDVVKLSA
jgi:hypothetical protein